MTRVTPAGRGASSSRARGSAPRPRGTGANSSAIWPRSADVGRSSRSRRSRADVASARSPCGHTSGRSRHNREVECRRSHGRMPGIAISACRTRVVGHRGQRAEVEAVEASRSRAFARTRPVWPAEPDRPRSPSSVRCKERLGLDRTVQRRAKPIETRPARWRAIPAAYEIRCTSVAYDGSRDHNGGGRTARPTRRAVDRRLRAPVPPDAASVPSAAGRSDRAHRVCPQPMARTEGAEPCA
jgi:hypothetical protein